MRRFSADAIAMKVPLLWRAVAAALLLGLALMALVEQRARILRNGAEVRLKTVPVDPRDLFRGDYVVLGYPISVVEAEQGAEPYRSGETVFVTLGRDEQGFARAVGVSREWPKDGGAAVVIAGRVATTSACVTRDDGTNVYGYSGVIEGSKLKFGDRLVSQMDVTHRVRRHHSLNRYVEAPQVLAELRHFAQADAIEPAAPIDSEHEVSATKSLRQSESSARVAQPSRTRRLLSVGHSAGR